MSAAGPLALEIQACEMAKRVVAYTTRVLVEKDLASLKEKQQHLEVLANMIIDVFAMDTVVTGTVAPVRVSSATGCAGTGPPGTSRAQLWRARRALMKLLDQ